MEMHDYLGQYREELPHWLAEYRPSDMISFKDIMSSRVAYYPGYGEDGTLLKVGNMSHCVHSFIHIDYRNTRESVVAQVDLIAGYHRIGHIEWNPEDLLPHSLYSFDRYLSVRGRALRDKITRCSDHHIMTDILERDEDKDDTHGARRIALTSISADGIEFYFQVFVKEYSKAPWLFLLQDHGFGCNYDSFGKRGILSRVMSDYDMYPSFIICDNKCGTSVYYGYEKIEDVSPVIGGMHRNVRHLFRRK